MKKLKTIGALLLCGLALTGCPKDAKTGAKTGAAKTAAKTAADAAKTAAKTAAASKPAK